MTVHKFIVWLIFRFNQSFRSLDWRLCYHSSMSSSGMAIHRNRMVLSFHERKWLFSHWLSQKLRTCLWFQNGLSTDVILKKYPQQIIHYIPITWSTSKNKLFTIFGLHEVFPKKISYHASFTCSGSRQLSRRFIVYVIAWPEPVKLAVFLVLL